MTDPISDFLTRLRNASKARLDDCVIPHSTLKENIAAILKTFSATECQNYFVNSGYEPEL